MPVRRAGARDSRGPRPAGGPEHLSPADEPYFYPGGGEFTPPEVSVPFRSVTGKTLQTVANGASSRLWTSTTTSSSPSSPRTRSPGRRSASGSGHATFEVQTNMQAPGLGCGNPLTAADGSVTGQPCWLVVIPRGTTTRARPGRPLGPPGGQLEAPARRAVGLQAARRAMRRWARQSALAGSELMTAAVGSWQPKLCGASAGSVYNLIISNEADQAHEANGTGTAPLALTARALSEPGVTDALTYAPVAVTGLTIAFAIDHPTRSATSRTRSGVLTGSRSPSSTSRRGWWPSCSPIRTGRAAARAGHDTSATTRRTSPRIPTSSRSTTPCGRTSR